MRIFTLVAAALTTAACSSASGPKPAELQRLEKPQEVRVLWSARIGYADRFVFFPAVVGDAVFAAARDGTVVRLDAAAKGAERWRVTLEKRLSAGVGASDPSRAASNPSRPLASTIKRMIAVSVGSARKKASPAAATRMRMIGLVNCRNNSS